jgi:hypothetical protein
MFFFASFLWEKVVVAEFTPLIREMLHRQKKGQVEEHSKEKRHGVVDSISNEKMFVAIDIEEKL